MATRLLTQMTDDLDPSKIADTTVRFGVEGAEYEIDLTAENASQLRKIIQLYVDASRRVGRKTRRAPRWVTSMWS